uniref:Uncharacterized protein n=1 Tax=Clastoptera arizonana TaxID=38151 RepID=A0A1B6C6A3_9HEMI
MAQNVKIWLESMGFVKENRNFGLDEELFNEIMPKNMKSMWSHMIKHAKTKEGIELIRKNLLLKKLKQNQMLKGKINMSLSLPDSLEKYVQMNASKESLKDLNKEKEYLVGKILDLKLRKREVKIKIEQKKEKIKEINTKQEICNIKINSNENKIKNLSELIQIIGELSKSSLETLEQVNESKSNIMKCVCQVKNYVKKCRADNMSTDDVKDDFKNISNLIREQTMALSSKTKFANFMQLLYSSNSEIKGIVNNAILSETKVEEFPLNFKPVEEHMIELNQLVVDNFRSEQEFQKKKNNKIIEIGNCKKELVLTIQHYHNIPKNEENEFINEYIEGFSKQMILEEMINKLKDSINKLKENDSSHEVFQTNLLQSELSILYNELNKKCLMGMVCKKSLTVQNERMRKVRDKLKQSLNKCLTNHFNNIPVNPCLLLSEIFSKELEMLLIVPLEALNRNWDTNLKMDNKSKLSFLNTPLEKIFLQQDNNFFYHYIGICYLQFCLKCYQNTKFKVIEFKNDETNISSSSAEKNYTPLFSSDIISELFKTFNYYKKQPLNKFDVPKDT